MNILYARLAVLLSISLLLSLQVWLHWIMLPPVVESGLLRIGGFAELLGWGLLVVLLIGVQIWQLPLRIRQTLTVGLTVWLVAATADVMDEVRVQPIWLSVYVEDVTRVLGMLIVTCGLLFLIRHVGRTMHELEQLSMVDPLTGLSNRRMFRHSVLSRAERGYSLILMDLDHFKNVNDRFGHDVGDRVLVQVAETLKQHRPRNAEVFRLGGEEFAIVTESITDTQLFELAEAVRTQISALDTAAQLVLTVSAGIGTLRQNETSAALIRRVDQALYRAKDKGRNQVMFAQPKPQEVQAT
ncbi:MAG: GGDEF domain-containing protein [Pseudomonadota bacterium]